MKAFLILLGIFLLIAGLFLTFAITVYSLKERDSSLYGFFICIGLIVAGIICIVTGLRKK